jgi:integrase
VADTRYLKQRRAGWYFQIKVPKDVAGKWPGSPLIVKSLNTRDLSKAQAARWPLVAKYTADFDVLRGNRKLTPQEIEEKAEVVFKEALEAFDEHGEDEDTLSVVIDLEREKIEKLEARPQLDDAQELELAKAWATIYAANGRAAALRGQLYQRPETFAPLRVDLKTLQPVNRKSHSKGTAVSFADAARRYVEEVQRDPAAKLTEQTRGQYEAVYRLFDSWAGQPTLDAVSRAKAAEFLDAVATLNPLWGRSPETKARTWADIFALFGNHPVGLSNRTLNRYATSLHLVWRWAKHRGLYEGEDPFTDQQRRKAERRDTEKLPFTEAELVKLLADKPLVKPGRHTAQTALTWVSWIAAYSGMRLNEIAGLRVSDVKRADGVWYFDVQGAKTEAGDRRVPVHSRLVKLGLLDYAKFVSTHAKALAQGGFMFPALKPGGPDKKHGWYLSKAFTVHRRSLGVTRIDPRSGKDAVDFHSFRRSAIRCLEVARVPQSEAAQVVGHERAGITFGTYNPEGLGLKALQKIVEKIDPLPTS